MKSTNFLCSFHVSCNFSNNSNGWNSFDFWNDVIRKIKQMRSRINYASKSDWSTECHRFKIIRKRNANNVCWRRKSKLDLRPITLIAINWKIVCFRKNGLCLFFWSHLTLLRLWLSKKSQYTSILSIRCYWKMNEIGKNVTSTRNGIHWKMRSSNCLTSSNVRVAMAN